MASTDAPNKGSKPGTAPADESTIVVNSQAEPASAPEAAPAEDEAVRPAMAELTGIKLSSPAVDRKTLTADDLRKLGADPKTEDDLVWSRDNGFVVPIHSVNASTVDALIKLPGLSAI